MTRLGINLRKRRQELNLTLEDVAKAIGINLTTYQKYEKGIIKNISSDKLEKLAICLKTSPEILMGWGNYTEEYKTKLQKLLENPNLKILFDATENLREEDIEFVTDLFIKFYNRAKKNN